MNKIKEIFDYYFNIICFCLIIFLLSGVIYIIYTCKSNKEKTNYNSELASVSEECKISSNDKIKVDIKGAIKNPGVYELESNSTVDDLIKLSGGLKKNATTENINLSKILENQMVIKIFTNTEYNKSITPVIEKVSECICPDVNINECKECTVTKISEEIKSNKGDEAIIEKNVEQAIEAEQKTTISINKASKEELMTLPGIGESKAMSIIEYRTNTPFNSIEDIKNVSGIGEALYEKIKEFISI